MTKLIVGLGNPGREFEETRHNIAWPLFEKLSFGEKLIWKEKFKGLFSVVTLFDEQTVFLKPQTYMNLSGESVRPAMEFFKVGLEDLLVVHDEIDLPFGTVHLKSGGGLAGNNGLKSINQHVGSKEFKRLRMGIGRPQFGDVSAHVLGRFSEVEKPLIDDFNDLGARALESYLKVGFQKAQNRFSKKTVVS